MSANTSFATITSSDLSRVSGGEGQTFSQFTNAERARIAPDYKNVVCTTAGVQGAPELAKGVYGAGVSDKDQIRAAEMLRSYCAGGTSLPAKAPKAPF